MEATRSITASATKMTLDAASRTKTLTTSATVATYQGSKYVTVGALKGTKEVTLGALKGTKDVSVQLFSSVAQQIPGYEKEQLDESVEPKERPPPVMADTTWADYPLSRVSEYTPERQLDQLFTAVDQEIQKAVQDAGSREGGSKSGLTRPPMHGAYLRAMSCVLIPVHRGEPDEMNPWREDGFKALRDRCGKVGKRERVPERMHEMIEQYLEDLPGKEAIMAGLEARLGAVDRNPFYSAQAFERHDDYDAWREREVNSIESQKVILKRYTKSEVVATVHELKMGNTHSLHGDDAEDVLAELSAAERRRIKAIEEEWNRSSLDVEEEEEDRGSSILGVDLSGSPAQNLKSMFGKAKSFLSPMKSVAKQALAPVATVTKTTVTVTTGGLVTGKMMDDAASKAKGAMVDTVVGKGLCWVTVSFGQHAHSTEQLMEEGGGDVAVRFQEGHVQWHLSPGERGAFKALVYRKTKYGLNANLKGKDEVVGTVTVHWDELARSGDTKQAIERWFECEEEETRKVRLSVQLITAPITGAETPIFDPRDNLVAVYTDMHQAFCGPETTMVRSRAIEWLLTQMRVRCGVGACWDRLLGLWHGLNLEMDGGWGRDAQVSVREGRIGHLLDCIRQGADLPPHTAVEKAIVAKALDMLRRQLRNQIIHFPFLLARGGEDAGEAGDEPQTLAMLVLLEHEVSLEIHQHATRDLNRPPPPPRPAYVPPKAAAPPRPPSPKAAPAPAPPSNGQDKADIDTIIGGISDDAFAAFDALQPATPTPPPPAPAYAAPTHEERAAAKAKAPPPPQEEDEGKILKLAMERFAVVFYGDELCAALRKGGMKMPGEGGQMGCKQLKRVAKRMHQMIARLVECFGGVLPHATLVACVCRVVDLLTVDMAAMIASYHIRNQMHPDNEDSFEDGSDEQLLLKLHYRINLLIMDLQTIDDSIDIMGLATATGPVLKAWIENMQRTIFKWMQTATANEEWAPCGEDSYHSHSVIDVFASAHQSVETFAALKMGYNSSVRLKFLNVLGDVCSEYMHCMDGAGQVEQDARAAEVRKRAEKTGSYAGMMTVMGGGVVSDLLFTKNDLTKMTALLTGAESEEQGQGAAEGAAEAPGAVKEDHWTDKGMEKMEHMADSLTDVSKWGSGLKSLGTKSLKASMNITKKTVHVATSATVKTVNVAASATAKTVNVVSMGTVSMDGTAIAHDKAPGPAKVFRPKDFYDGSQLVSPGGCVRMSNACKVKEQMDQMVTRLEAAEKEHGVVPENDWTVGETVTKTYERIKFSIQSTFELELGPLLRQVHNGIRAALTEEGGTPPIGTDPVRRAVMAAHYEAGMEMVRGPDWKWGNQDGGKDPEGKVSVGTLTEVKANSWVKVRWPSGNEESYRVGCEGMCDVMPNGLEAPEEDLAPALQAIVDALDNNLALLRNNLDDRNFATCLRITWLSSIDVLQEIINDDMSGDIHVVRRANAVLRQLRGYMHADGAGVPKSLIERSSDALQRMLEASLM